MRGGSKHSPTDWNLSKSHLAVWHFSHSTLNWCGMFFFRALVFSKWLAIYARPVPFNKIPPVRMYWSYFVDTVANTAPIYTRRKHQCRQTGQLGTVSQSPFNNFYSLPFFHGWYISTHCVVLVSSLCVFSPSTWFLRLSKTRLHSPRHVSDERRKDVCPIIVPIVPHCFSIAPAFSFPEKENLRKASIVSCFALYRIIDDGNSRRG